MELDLDEFRTIITAGGLLSAALSAFLGLFVGIRRRDSPAAVPFSLLMAVNTLYALAYTIELNTPDLEAATRVLKVEYVGVMMVPVFWKLFAARLVDPGRKEPAVGVLALAAIPAATMVLMWTNEFHHLVYTSLSLEQGVPLTVIVGSRGWWYWVSTIYQYGLILLGTIGILRWTFTSSGIFKTQSLLVATGVLVPWAGHIALLFHAGLFNLDPTPFGLSIAGILFSVGIFRHQLFDLSPIARERVLDAFRDGVVVVDARTRYIDANRSARAVLPELSRMKIGCDAATLMGSLGLDPASEPAPGGDKISATRELRVDRAERKFKLECVPIDDERGRRLGSAVTIVDITEMSALLQRLETLATTDELTEAHNRRWFFELAERELALARRNKSRVAFAMLDLDHFKRINDKYGHGAGDQVLKAVSQLCRGFLRAGDLFCRYGGEEFVILFPGATVAAALEVADRLRGKIEAAKVSYEGKNICVKASFGVTGSAAPPLASLDEYLKRVDASLYEAKNSGRNCVASSSGD